MFNSIYTKLILAVAVAGLSTGCNKFNDALGGNPNSYYKMDDGSDIPAPDDITPPTGDGTTGSDTSGSTSGSSSGSDAGSVSSGSTSGSASGSDSGSVSSGSTSGSASGSDSGSVSSGSTSGSASGSDSGSVSSGSTSGSDTSGSTSGSDTGGSGVGSTGGDSGGSSTGDATGGNSGESYGPVADSSLRYGLRNSNEGANIMLHIGEDANQAIVLFNVPADKLANAARARLIFTVDAHKYGVNSGPSQNWPAMASKKNYIYAHRLLSRSIAEGNGRQRGHEHLNKSDASFGQMLSQFYMNLIGSSEVDSRGVGAGVTVNCLSDSNVDNNARDCASGSAPAFVFDPKLADYAATDKAMHVNDMAEGQKVEFNVTADVKAGYAGWVVKDSAGGGMVRYYSKEGAAFKGDLSLAPQLIIE